MKRLESDGCEDCYGQPDSIDARWRHEIQIVARQLRTAANVDIPCRPGDVPRADEVDSRLGDSGLPAKASNRDVRRENAERDARHVPAHPETRAYATTHAHNSSFAETPSCAGSTN